MKKLIELEGVPSSFLKTSLTQIWKKKGSTIDLNNMRFFHMRQWRSKLLEALITEVMKDDTGGMHEAFSVEHLVTLKTWMKLKRNF